MKRIFILLILCNSFLNSYSQKDSTKRKHSFYGMWGYNRVVYTPSTIHFVNTGNANGHGPYDFVVKDAKAKDSPDFDALKDVINITIPQFSFRIGMWFNNKNDEGWELNYDHTKYVVIDRQVARFTGTINGVYVDKDSLIDRNYFHFEHTDGANFWMINYMKRSPIFYSKNNKFKLGYVIKPGFGVVIPRTDVTLFGEHLNNNWKLAGITAGFETAIRLELYKHYVIELAGKAGWANYINSLVLGKGNGKASHQFGYIEGILSIGYQF